MVKLGIYPEDWAGDVSNDGGNFGERPWVARRGDGFREELNPSYALDISGEKWSASLSWQIAFSCWTDVS
jgi:hypothetical protein